MNLSRRNSPDHMQQDRRLPHNNGLVRMGPSQPRLSNPPGNRHRRHTRSESHWTSLTDSSNLHTQNEDANGSTLVPKAIKILTLMIATIKIQTKSASICTCRAQARAGGRRLKRKTAVRARPTRLTLVVGVNVLPGRAHRGRVRPLELQRRISPAHRGHEAIQTDLERVSRRERESPRVLVSERRLKSARSNPGQL